MTICSLNLARRLVRALDGDIEVGSEESHSNGPLIISPRGTMGWMGVELQLPSPGMEDAGEAGKIGPEETRVFGKGLQSPG